MIQLLGSARLRAQRVCARAAALPVAAPMHCAAARAVASGWRSASTAAVPPSERVSTVVISPAPEKQTRPAPKPLQMPRTAASTHSRAPASAQPGAEEGARARTKRRQEKELDSAPRRPPGGSLRGADRNAVHSGEPVTTRPPAAHVSLRHRPAADVTSTLDTFLPPRIKREFEMRVIHDAARLSLSYLRNVISTNARAGFAKRVPALAMPELAPAVTSVYGAPPLTPAVRRRKGPAGAPATSDAHGWIARELAGWTALRGAWVHTLMAMRLAHAAAFSDRLVVSRRLGSGALQAVTSPDAACSWAQLLRKRTEPGCPDGMPSEVYDALLAEAQPVVYAMAHFLVCTTQQSPETAARQARGMLLAVDGPTAPASHSVPMPHEWAHAVDKLCATTDWTDALRRAWTALLTNDTHPAFPLTAPLMFAFLGDQGELSRCMSRVVQQAEGACVRQAAFLLNELAANSARRNPSGAAADSDTMGVDTGLNSDIVLRLRKVFGAVSTAMLEGSAARQVRVTRVPGVGDIASKQASSLTPEQVVATVRDAKKSKRFRGMYDTAAYLPDAWLDALERLGFPAGMLTAMVPSELQHVARAAASPWSLPPPLVEYSALLRHSVLLLRQRYLYKGRRPRPGSHLLARPSTHFDSSVAASIVDGKAVAPSSKVQRTAAAKADPSVEDAAGGDEKMTAAGLLYLSRVGLPKMTKAALVAGSRKLLTFIAMHADTDAKFAFRKAIVQLEEYRASRLVPRDTAHSKASTGRAAAVSSKGRLVEERDTGGKEFVYTDMLESDASRAILRAAVECVPPQQRQATYPRALRYLGVLRLSEVDQRLFGSGVVVPATSESDAAGPRRKDVQQALAAALKAPPSSPLPWGAVWQELNKVAQAKRTDTTASSGSAAVEVVDELPLLDAAPTLELEATADGASVAPPSAQTEAAPAVVPSVPVQPLPAAHSVDVQDVARRLSVMLNSRDFERLLRLLRVHIAVSRRLQRKWKKVAEAKHGKVLSEQEALATQLRLADKEFYLSDLLQERLRTTARAASGIFGSLAYMLDADFMAVLSSGRLHPGVLLRARKRVLLQDAEMAIAEELVLDDEAAGPGGSDPADELSRHFLRVQGVAGATSPPTRPTPAAQVLDAVHRSFQTILFPLVMPRGATAAQEPSAPSSAAMAALAQDMAAVREAAQASMPPASALPPRSQNDLAVRGPWADAAGNAAFDSWGRVGVATSSELFQELHVSGAPTAAALVAEMATTVPQFDPDDATTLRADDEHVDDAALDTPAADAFDGTDDHSADTLDAADAGEADSNLVRAADGNVALQRVHTYLSHTITIPIRLQASVAPSPVDMMSAGLAAETARSTIVHTPSSPDSLMARAYPGVSYAVYSLAESGPGLVSTGTSPSATDYEAWNTPERVACKVMLMKLPFSCRPEDVVTAFRACGKIARVELWRDRADAVHKQLKAQEVFLQQKSRWQVTEKLIKAHDKEGDDGGRRAPLPAGPHVSTVHAGAAPQRAFSTAADRGREAQEYADMVRSAESALTDDSAGRTASASRKVGKPKRRAKSKAEAAGAPDDGLDALRPSGPFATRRMYKAFEERRRKYNLVSPLHAFVYFDTREGAEAATVDVLRLFGVVVFNQACRTEPATACKTLYIGNAWRGTPPDGVLAALTAMLAHTGVTLSLTDAARLRQGMLSNGEVLVEFPSHAAAVRIAHALRGAQTQHGSPLVVGWATADEWQQARPKLPVYF